MFCWGRQLFLVIVILLGISQMIAACGQKGPLYLPEDQAARPAAKGNGSLEPAASPTSTPPEIPGPEPLPPPIR